MKETKTTDIQMWNILGEFQSNSFHLYHIEICSQLQYYTQFFLIWCFNRNGDKAIWYKGLQCVIDNRYIQILLLTATQPVNNLSDLSLEIYFGNICGNRKWSTSKRNCSYELPACAVIQSSLDPSSTQHSAVVELWINKKVKWSRWRI